MFWSADMVLILSENGNLCKNQNHVCFNKIDLLKLRRCFFAIMRWRVFSHSFKDFEKMRFIFKSQKAGNIFIGQIGGRNQFNRFVDFILFYIAVRAYP